MINRLKYCLAASLMSVLSACTFSYNNDLVSEHPDEVEAFTSDVFDYFYAKRSDDILRVAAEGVGFTADQLDAIYEFISESGQPDQAVEADHRYRRQNATKYFITVFHVPRDKGREVVTITVSGEGETCCRLYGLHLNQQIGEQYVMEGEPADETSTEE